MAKHFRYICQNFYCLGSRKYGIDFPTVYPKHWDSVHGSDYIASIKINPTNSIYYTMSRGIILMNLGSPDSTSIPDLKVYLKEFLMDERVIDKPFWQRTLLVKGIIVPFRAPKSAEAYKSIWWPEGSPLVVLTTRLQKALQEKVTEPVEVAMRYRLPHPKTAYDNLLKKLPNLDEVVLVPLYPHYAMSSWETAVEYMKEIHKKYNYNFKLKTVPPFFKHPAYIHALAESMRPHLQNDYDQLLFSYHGIPQSHIFKTGKPGAKHDLDAPDKCCDDTTAQDTCYRHQVIQTTLLATKALGIPRDKWAISFQSRLGRDPWLLPSSQERIPNLPNEGVKKIKVICPSFISDCLETLEEIDTEGKKDFLAHGGESFDYIPCLNTHEVWVDSLVQLIKEAKD
ncbi:MAG TPA: ferrochelatase [Niabella sp.]|nr:ferrochelatase [Niabella sp.]HOZ98035.1 ferrochelatase [Niabella sp.]HQW14820.1 ferrochelatase [Niabella sp.]HQX18555.1 ferrochelatase [Niabella sp.]HQX40775.1 ferrochelatase [Niabella sp.]